MTHPGVGAYMDRHGKQRWRYRKGALTVSLPGLPGDQKFETAYEAAAVGKKFVSRSMEIRRASFLDHYAKRALAKAKERAARKDVEFSMGSADVGRLMESQDWRCAVSAIPFIVDRQTNEQEEPFRPSIDRITPGKGYVIGNVRLVCEIVNLAMNRWGEKPLLQLVEAMADLRRG